MYQRLRGPYYRVSIQLGVVKRKTLPSYNLPETGVCLVGLLIKTLVLGHPVLGVDHTDVCVSYRLVPRPMCVRRAGAALGAARGPL